MSVTYHQLLRALQEVRDELQPRSAGRDTLSYLAASPSLVTMLANRINDAPRGAQEPTP